MLGSTIAEITPAAAVLLDVAPFLGRGCTHEPLLRHAPQVPSPPRVGAGYVLPTLPSRMAWTPVVGRPKPRAPHVSRSRNATLWKAIWVAPVASRLPLHHYRMHGTGLNSLVIGSFRVAEY